MKAGNGLMVINCPKRHFIYNAAEFIRSGNRGLTDFGADHRLASVQNSIGEETVTIVDEDLRLITAVGPRDSSILPQNQKHLTVLPNIIYVYYNYGNLPVTSAFLFKRKSVIVVLDYQYILLVKADGFAHSTK
jgi:hypothetical protein